MQIKSTNKSYLEWSGDALAIGLFANVTEISGNLARLDAQLEGVITELMAENEFEAKSGTTLVTRIGSKTSIRKLIVVGLGEETDLTLDTFRQASAAIARIAKQEKVKTLGISLPMADYNEEMVTQMIAEGLILALHLDNRFKSEPQDQEAKLETVEVLNVGEQEKAITKAEIISSGVILARELVNAPANSLTSLTMTENVQKLAAEYNLTLEILEQEDCEKLGMGAFLGVAKASDLPPKFLHLIYKPQKSPQKKVAIVGKGLTFDSGGLNLKVNGGIETMKMDMGGAAATFGAAKAIAQLKPDVEVHFISAVTENMISGKAMHPGDILTASNGKTIEVNNTDAEGRLTLADALVFADRLGTNAIVDLATLTGACIVALGNDIAGLWSNDQKLTTEIKTAAESAGEKFWQMPLEEKYFEGMKSPLADLKNTGPRSGGSITAALFLQQFVKDTPWIHLDIAGPVWADKISGVNNEGATGFGVRTLVNWVLNQ
jgi:leucyl aminopeptidase